LKTSAPKIASLLSIILCSAVGPLMSFSSVNAATTEGISRGEATDLTVKYLQLEKTNKSFLNSCKLDIGTCLFTFSTRTNFTISLKPVILYPDVYPAYRYYKSINVASELDLVRGYFEEDNSPFKPEQPITRVEALKLALGATKVLDWKEKFELANDTSFQEEGNWIQLDFDAQKWWYSRYLAAAQTNGFWTSVTAQEAEEGISKDDFLKLLDNANKIVASRQTSSLADTSDQGQAKANQSTTLAF